MCFLNPNSNGLHLFSVRHLTCGVLGFVMTMSDDDDYNDSFNLKAHFLRMMT